MTGKLDFKAIAQAALASAERLVPDWLPNGKRDGHEWRCGSVRGEPGRSLAVNLNTGVWSDFSSDDQKGGDLISLYAAIFHNDNQGAAAKELAAQLGLSGANIQPAHELRSATAGPKRKTRTRAVWRPILPVPQDAEPAPKAHVIRGRPESRWTYYDAAGALLGYVYRFKTSDGGKEIIPCCWAENPDTGRSEWRWLAFPEPRPLYGIERFTGKEYVLVVEGEKCVDAAYRGLGQWFDVVSWPGGGKAVSKADWSQLAGRKVIIWPDCDAKVHKITGELLPEQPIPPTRGQRGVPGQPGIKAAEDIANILLGLGCDVRIVTIPTPGTVADGWDVADAIAAGTSGEELKAWIYKNLRAPHHAEGASPTPVDKVCSTPRTAGAQSDWMRGLIKKPRGGFEDCKENVAIALEQHPDLVGLVGYNEFSARIEKLRTPPWRSDGVEWTEEDDLELSMWMGINADLLFKNTATIVGGVRLVAHRNKFHPVREWLESLEWDGQERLDSWLQDCLGVRDTEYAQLVGTLWMRQAVNRILNPGCKGDYVLILEGTQGLMKSSSLRALGGEWFSDAPLDLNSKDAFMSINGTWIYEIAELDAFNRTEATRIKAFLTQSHDRYRPPYGTRMVTQLRQTVFAATTNNFEYHKDPTGNRRFWSVLCTKIDIDLIKEMRAQLFAQAVYEVKQGEPVYPTREQETRLIVPEQQMREIVDPWHEKIALWLDDPVQAAKDRFTSAEILTGAIGMEIAKIDGQRSATTRIGSIMMRLGWKKKRETTGHRLYYYERPEQTASSVSTTSRQEYESLPV